MDLSVTTSPVTPSPVINPPKPRTWLTRAGRTITLNGGATPGTNTTHRSQHPPSQGGWRWKVNEEGELDLPDFPPYPGVQGMDMSTSNPSTSNRSTSDLSTSDLSTSNLSTSDLSTSDLSTSSTSNLSTSDLSTSDPSTSDPSTSDPSLSLFYQPAVGTRYANIFGLSAPGGEKKKKVINNPMSYPGRESQQGSIIADNEDFFPAEHHRMRTSLTRDGKKVPYTTKLFHLTNAWANTSESHVVHMGPSDVDVELHGADTSEENTILDISYDTPLPFQGHLGSYIPEDSNTVAGRQNIEANRHVKRAHEAYNRAVRAGRRPKPEDRRGCKVTRKVLARLMTDEDWAAFRRGEEEELQRGRERQEWERRWEEFYRSQPQSGDEGTGGGALINGGNLGNLRNLNGGGNLQGGRGGNLQGGPGSGNVNGGNWKGSGYLQGGPGRNLNVGNVMQLLNELGNMGDVGSVGDSRVDETVGRDVDGGGWGGGGRGGR
ncbi:hypothetical protein HDV00_006482 [Rhizophlyctis rosea]|nr:hypothetical protein HDV00_006482 [Rhizophlyctis rosea]